MSTTPDLLMRIKALETELLSIKKQKRYGLVWEDKPEDIVERCKTELPVLVEDESRRISKGGDAPTHILIEGDNYPALSVLAYTHEKRVDVIYIDPPYNTGSEDFIYNDCYVDKEDAFRHSKWISFMEKRLETAKTLLKETGTIFISIDDNEHAQLKVLCDEIFGSDNFIGNIAWESKTKSQNTKTAYDKLQPKIEYILVYTKQNKRRFNLRITGQKEYHLNDDSGPYRLYKIEQMNSEGIRGRESMVYEILGISPPNGKQWKLGLEIVSSFQERGDLIIDNNTPTLKMRPDDERNDITEPFWGFLNKEIGTAESAKKELTKVLESSSHGFETVKPVELIKRILFHSTDTDSIVLDFFAGSGTTGHAVLELNSEDGGSRQAILVTNNENQIAETVTYPRMQRVISGYADVAGIPANLRYYRTDFIAVDRSIDDLRSRFMGRCSEMLCIRESCYDRVEMVDTSEYLQVFENRTQILAILYHPYEIERFERWARETTREIVVYIFSMGVEIFQEELAHLSPRIRIETIPDEILETYQKIFGF